MHGRLSGFAPTSADLKLGVCFATRLTSECPRAFHQRPQPSDHGDSPRGLEARADGRGGDRLARENSCSNAVRSDAPAPGPAALVANNIAAGVVTTPRAVRSARCPRVET